MLCFYFNPRSPCGERPSFTLALARGFTYFNPRSPCGERPEPYARLPYVALFQPTLPVRGATCAFCFGSNGKNDFNPRSPCGERLSYAYFLAPIVTFQPTLPVRGATFFAAFWAMCRAFQPTLPVRGATMALIRHMGLISVFQPTLPVRGATWASEFAAYADNISTHAPRAGSDASLIYAFSMNTISTHAPRAGSDPRSFSPPSFLIVFQPTLPVRGATPVIKAISQVVSHFNPRSPCGERLQTQQ